jgi:hypothetical protein
MSDVTAVLFTIGEPYADRAVASVRAQTLPVADLVVIGATESPFHRAFNAGARRVRTEFFLQVDADLVLDPDCVAVLRSCMRDQLGIVTGRLRDPLLGRIGAVRLLRTACFERLAFPDTVAPDTDFIAAIGAAGWRRLDALRRRPGPRDLWHTFGEHRPDYTPLYTFAKFRLDGCRYRYRRDPYTLRDLTARLHRSAHHASRLALVALMHGVFHRDAHDQLQRYEPDREFELIVDLLSGAVHGSSPAIHPVPDSPTTADETVYLRFHTYGAELARRGETASVYAVVEHLGAAAPSHPGTLIALLAVCHGLFESVTARADPGADFALLEGWLTGDSANART